MSDPKPVPEALFSIPDDASPEDKLHLRAQMVIQAAFYVFGDPDERPGTMSLGTGELLEVLNFATAMLLASSQGLRTRSDIRKVTEAQEKYIRSAAEALQGDNTVPQMLAMLGMDVSRPS